MPRLQKTRTHAYDCSCIDCGVTRSLSPVTPHGLNCSCHQCHMIYTTTTNTSGVLPNTFTVTGTTYTLGSGSGPVITGVKEAYRPCGRPWHTECSCGFCYKPQLSLQFEESPVFRHTKTEIPKSADSKIETVLDTIITTRGGKKVLEKALAFLSGLNLQNHPVKDQREQADVLREIMKVLKPERYNR